MIVLGDQPANRNCRSSGSARTATATFGAECKRDADGEDGQGGQQAGRCGAVDARPDNREGVAGRHAVVLTFQARCAGRALNIAALSRPSQPRVSRSIRAIPGRFFRVGKGAS